MGTHYTQLSLWERQRMFDWYHIQKMSCRKIARLLNRSHTTISREIKRNTSTQGNSLRWHVDTWYPHPANGFAKIRARNRGRRARLKNAETKSFVLERLKMGWTPEIIAGRSKIEPNVSYICHESIYQYIYKEAPEHIQHLPRKHKKRKKKFPYRSTKQKTLNKTSIEDRPTDIDDRLVVGHWESDSIVSPKQQPGCNVVVERVTRLTHITKLASKDSKTTHNALVSKLKDHPKEFVKSITYDNGVENTKHMETNMELSCDSYFCLPYHSWEKGAVEQVNGLIRRYLPKKTDITQVSEKEISTIEHSLNSRPRKCLQFKTPYEVYEEYFGEKANCNSS